MTAETTSCVVIKCDGCERSYMGYEDEFTCHFDSAEAFAKDNAETEIEYRWKVDGDKHLCVECWCAEEGHPSDDDHIYGKESGKPHRYCRCQKTWPVEVGA